MLRDGLLRHQCINNPTHRWAAHLELPADGEEDAGAAEHNQQDGLHTGSGAGNEVGRGSKPQVW